MSLESLGAAQAQAWLRLAFAPGLPPRTQRRLLKAFGSPQAALAAARQDAIVLPPEAGAALRGPGAEQAADQALDWLAGGRDRHLLVLGDAAYPRLLLEIPDPPTVLFAHGDPRFLDAPSVAIVGSRNGSTQGCIDAESFAFELSQAGLCVVSGLARGIDGSAHEGALRGEGSTVAVMATGPDRIYPHAHRGLAERITESGCIVTEFPVGTRECRWNFPRRNRLISGLSRGVVVVEAARNSGSLITASCALDQNREVFAVPGSIHATLSKGCHALIRDGAMLVQNAHEVMDELRWPHGAAADGEEAGEPGRSPDRLLDALPYAPTSMDELAARTRLPIAEVAAGLSRLELQGHVEAIPGGRFVRIKRTGRPRVIE